MNIDLSKNVDKKNILNALEEKFNNSRIDYYRFVIRKEDEYLFQRLLKIPDDWTDFKTSDGQTLSEEQYKRLSDIKLKKSWELRFESLYIYFLTNIENTINSCFRHRDLTVDEINEAIDSLNSVILELDEKLVNFKHLLFTLAKRAVSDLYYFLNSFYMFYYKKKYVFEDSTKDILKKFIEILQDYKEYQDQINVFLEYDNKIAKFFPKSSNSTGWKMDEFAVKEFLETSNQIVKIAEIRKVIQKAYKYKNVLHNNYNFLKFYYNAKDGKLFRLNFITESLAQKHSENKISQNLLDSFIAIRENFLKYKTFYDKLGIVDFGSSRITYFQLLNFIYKGCKIIEFYYLRTSRYEDLQNFRNDMLYYIEKEFYKFIDE